MIADPVHQIVGHHFAADARLGEARRHRQGLHHKAVGMGGVPHRHAKTDDDTQPHRQHGQPQHHANALFPKAQRKLFQLFVQVMALVFDQFALGAQEGIRFSAAGAGQRHFLGRRIDRPADVWRAVTGSVFFFGHLCSPARALVHELAHIPTGLTTRPPRP